MQIYFSIAPLRQRTISESRLDTTSVGRVRTHSGCNPSVSPFHMPFSPPMSPYMIQPQSCNAPQEQQFTIKTPNKTTDQSAEEHSISQKQTEHLEEHDYPS